MIKFGKCGEQLVYTLFINIGNDNIAYYYFQTSILKGIVFIKYHQ